MIKILLSGFIALFVIGCATPTSPRLQNVVTPTVVTPREPTNLMSLTPTPTRTPWPTLVFDETPLLQTDLNMAGSNITPVVPPTSTKASLNIICPSDRLSVISGYGLVTLFNFIGQPGWNVEIQIGSVICSVPPGKGGYAQLQPGKYSWTAKVPVRGGLGSIRGDITVVSGNNNPEIVFCIVDNRLATIPQCPGPPELPISSPR